MRRRWMCMCTWRKKTCHQKLHGPKNAWEVKNAQTHYVEVGDSRQINRRVACCVFCWGPNPSSDGERGSVKQKVSARCKFLFCQIITSLSRLRHLHILRGPSRRCRISAPLIFITVAQQSTLANGKKTLHTQPRRMYKSGMLIAKPKSEAAAAARDWWCRGIN